MDYCTMYRPSPSIFFNYKPRYIMKTLTIDLLVKSAQNIIDKNGNAEIEFSAEPEDMDPDFDDSIMEEFNETLKNDFDLQYCGVSHNWFCAKVTVKYLNFEETEYLGGCSYESYDGFVLLPDDYFVDMVSTCVENINKQITAHNEEIQKRWNLRKSLMRKGTYQDFMAAYHQLKAILQ